jgi:ferredoxin-like protein FixX
VRADGTFIAVEVDDTAASDADIAKRLAEACPVDIFAQQDGHVAIVQENVDECVLCRLCLDAVGDAVKVIKLYDGDSLLA